MRELPILFSTPMVQAILNDQKDVTRRLFDIQPDPDCYFEMKRIVLPDGRRACCIDYNQGDDNPIVIPKYQVGDILYVRESWANGGFITSGPGVIFRDPHMEGVTKWKPGIHLKKEHSRIWIKVVDITVERIQDITEMEAIREGVKKMIFLNGEHVGWKNYGKPERNKVFLNKEFARQSFQTLWESINGKDSWDKNPWVWRYAFKVLSKNGRPEKL